MYSADAFTLKKCVPEKQLPFLLRFGVVRDTSMPVLLPMPWHKPLFVHYYPSDYAVFAHTLQNYLLQLLLQAPTHALQVILVDRGLTGDFSTLDRIRQKTKKKAVEIKALKSKRHGFLADLLASATQRRTLLNQSGCADWQEYQKRFAQADAVLIVCISDITHILLNEESFDDLDRLIDQGAELGILIWALLPVHGYDQFNSHDDRKMQLGIQQLKNKTWHMSLYDRSRLSIVIKDSAWQDMFSVMQQQGIEVEQDTQSSLDYAVAQLEQRYNVVDPHVGDDFLKIQIGLCQAQPFYFQMGAASGVYHGLIAGTTGSGKSSFLNRLILAACEKYQPDELQFFLFDYKEGIEFQIFSRLAHVPVLHLDNRDQGALLHYLGVYHAEIRQRGELFRQHGCASLDQYNKIAVKNRQKKLARWMMIVDEVQALLKNRNILAAIDDIARQGRAFGLHMLFSTQTYQDVNLEGGVKGQFGLRIAFQLAANLDCHYLFGRDNNAALSVPRFHVVYNAASGEAGANQVVKLDFISSDSVRSRLDVLRQKYRYQPDARFDYHPVNDVSTPSKKSSWRDRI